MSLTKAGLLEKAQGRFAWVEDVPVFGTIGVRSCPQLEASMRWVSYRNQDTGKIIPEERAKAEINDVIDQIMLDEQTPMFTDDDFADLAALDTEVFAHLTTAIRTFNDREENSEKKDSA